MIEGLGGSQFAGGDGRNAVERSAHAGPPVIGGDFGAVTGEVKIERGGRAIWQKAIETGEENMSHSLINLEHHHFKFELHRRPGDVHIHFLGAHSLSFGQGIELKDGDVMEIHFSGLGRPLRNRVQVIRKKDSPVEVVPLV